MSNSFAKKGEFAFRVIAGETLLVPIKAGVGELGSIFTFNEVGAAIWALVGPERTAEDITRRICEEFDVSVEKAARDVESFLGALLEKGLIEPAGAVVEDRGLR
jgi:hypothetical protein